MDWHKGKHFFFEEMTWLFYILNLLFLQDRSVIFTLLLWGEKKFLTDIHLSRENKGDESYCFWKRFLVFLKGKMSAHRKLTTSTATILTASYWTLNWLVSGNHNLTLRCWKQHAMCPIWWFWICSCGLCSRSANDNTPDWTDDSVSDTRLVSITFFKQVSNFHWCSNSDTGLFPHLYKASSRIP